MTKDREKPIYDRYFLTGALEQALKKGSPLRQYPLGPNQKNEVNKEKNKVYIRFEGSEHLMWFEEQRKSIQEQDTLQYFFYDYVFRISQNNVEKVRGFIENRKQNISKDCKNIFEKIYGDIKVDFTEAEFHGNKNEGALVQVKIKSLPLGKNDHLSMNLFEYAYNVIFLPAMRVAINGQPVNKAAWYRFFPDKKHKEDST